MIIHIVGLIGVTIIICRGEIFTRVRKIWPAFLSCPLCVGFWVGAADGGLRQPFALSGVWLIDRLIDGGLVGISSLIVSAWLISKLGDPIE